jgi:glycosyltransferase involved in cell wall biosynthesis
MQLIGDLNIGGAQEVVRTLSKYLLLHDCHPVVCTLEDGPLREEIESLGIVVEILPPRRYTVVAFPLFLLDMLRIWKALADLIRKYDVDIIQTHILGVLNFLVLVLRYTTPLRAVIWTFHNSEFELSEAKLLKHRWLLGPKIFAYRLFYRLGSFLVDGFVAVSDQVKEAILDTIGANGNKVTVICNGVDTQKFSKTIGSKNIRGQLGFTNNQYLIIVVATLKEQKGHRYLIDALSSIVQEYPNVHGIFVGDGSLKEELRLQIDELNLTNHITLLGNRTDIPQLLAASNLFVLPSLWEGLPMALLEAMASRLPVVATEVSGTVQVLKANESGILVKPGDQLQLIEAIKYLLKFPDKARNLGVAARLRVEESFSARKQANDHFNLFQELLDRRLKPHIAGL